MMTAKASYVPQSYHPYCEAAINHQISLELYAAHRFEVTASYFHSQEVALKHFAQFFLQQASQEMEHAHRLMELQNQRGGRLCLQDISSHDRSCWENCLMAMECALHLKMGVNQSLLKLHQLAVQMRDANLCDFLKSDYLFQQMKFIQELEGHITNLRQMEAPESGLAEDLCAKLTLGDSKKKN